MDQAPATEWLRKFLRNQVAANALGALAMLVAGIGILAATGDLFISFRCSPWELGLGITTGHIRFSDSFSFRRNGQPVVSLGWAYALGIEEHMVQIMVE